MIRRLVLALLLYARAQAIWLRAMSAFIWPADGPFINHQPR
jgi:hypothetical protein